MNNPRGMFALQLGSERLDRLGAFADKVTRDNVEAGIPGKVSRAAVIRVALDEYLDTEE